jgi:ubiquinone/menaquinone biosynthesis C-methylase UbiE
VSVDLFDLLRCPATGSALLREGHQLVTPDARVYRLDATGIPLFDEGLGAAARKQQAHYDKIAEVYVANLDYPHTRTYQAYLDAALLDALVGKRIGVMAEICCGHGEALALLDDRVEAGIGVDVSLAMLRRAHERFAERPYLFVQGDATRLPLADAAFDSVVMLGGIHHVGDRERLFGEIARILKPGGVFAWREPVSDFFLWRALRALIYRVSPLLDAETERPLLYRETVPVLERAGLSVERWTTHGFLGFCLLMNSDVLVFNRLFRFVPGIRSITRAMCRFDDIVTRLRPFSRAGLQVVGLARKP